MAHNPAAGCWRRRPAMSWRARCWVADGGRRARQCTGGAGRRWARGGEVLGAAARWRRSSCRAVIMGWPALIAGSWSGVDCGSRVNCKDYSWFNSKCK
jgi:hypothetical protein